MTTKISDNHWGKPFFAIYRKGGAHIMAKKPDNKNVTIRESAALIPATTTTKAANTKSTRVAPENPLTIELIIFPNFLDT